ncbi:hypothetical protein Moror_3713 [Moniliophthora roreri MCA 2997]|uniref:Uncharacterized protein n=2 Tax=Moniliophthora roreri TaxID=221103 RepID=V2WLG0_MONRO|nr:hypothetical protein Moror_3713 [Moniliophthora roreri MCA 2997]
MTGVSIPDPPAPCPKLKKIVSAKKSQSLEHESPLLPEHEAEHEAEPIPQQTPCTTHNQPCPTRNTNPTPGTKPCRCTTAEVKEARAATEAAKQAALQEKQAKLLKLEAIQEGIQMMKISEYRKVKEEFEIPVESEGKGKGEGTMGDSKEGEPGWTGAATEHIGLGSEGEEFDLPREDDIFSNEEVVDEPKKKAGKKTGKKMGKKTQGKGPAAHPVPTVTAIPQSQLKKATGFTKAFKQLLGQKIIPKDNPIGGLHDSDAEDTPPAAKDQGIP